MSSKHIDHLLKDWAYEPDGCVRMIKGADGRDLLQVRIDLGVLQLETSGRPDGHRPEGFATILDMLIDRELHSPDLELDDELCEEIDREFVQFYHRRIAWLRLQRFDLAVRDASHTLALMDFCREHSPDEEWTFQHEQHRSFVVFHKTQASSLIAIEQQQPVAAIEQIELGLEEIRDSFVEMGWEEFYDSDELVLRLRELRDNLQSDESLPKSLQQQLDEAIRSEQYELAAVLRDKMSGQEHPSR
jgi:UvrB/uvrC motif